MSAARRRLMWLWAAVWLRWRLMRVKAPRLFGGRAVAVGGLDYHLAPAETPVEGLDYDPGELPAQLTAKLEATRFELLERARDRAAPARPRRARRRRIAVLATAGMLGLGAVGAGAAALVTGSTGVPAVDRLLGIYEADVSEPGSSGRPGGTGRDLQPRSSGASVSVEAPLDASQIVSTSYVAKDGRVCSALADRKENRSVGDLACIPPGALARRHEVVLAVNIVNGQAIIRGFVSGNVTKLSGQGPQGPIDVHLGERWTPNLSGIGSLKPFLALGDPEAPGDSRGPNGSDPLRQADPGGYTFDGVTQDGEGIRIKP
jgi:hypothetical protein